MTIRLALAALLLALLAGLRVPLAQAAGITVTTASEGSASGDGCSLREAITNANNDNQSGSTECAAGSGADTITFAGDYTITLASTLPNLTGNLTIDGSGHSITVSGNNAVRVFNIQAGAVVTMSRLSIINGTASGSSGGGIHNWGTLTVSHSTFGGNSATTGGGIYNALGTVTVSHSTFSGNSASNGGGIVNNGGTVTVSNSTFSGNSASSSGGGIITGGSSQGSTVTVSNSTFSGNSASSSGGGIYNFGNSALHLRNTIIANSPSGGDCYNIGTIATNVNNLIEDSTCNGGATGFITSDPLLGPLDSYGGSTPTFALLPGSPAIDAAGDCTPFLDPDEDQRGMTRPQGSACDIGAFEAREQIGPNFVVNVSDDSDDGACDLFGVGALDCTLREAINAANSQAGADTITFAGDYTITLASALPNLASGLTIDGSGHSVTVSGNHAVRVFFISPSGVVTLSNLSLINGIGSLGNPKI